MHTQVLTYRQIKEKYGVGVSGIAGIKKNRVHIETALQTKSPRKKFSTRKVISPSVDKKTIQFFQEARQKHLPVSGWLLRNAAVTFAAEEGDTVFAGSRGWLRCFQDRHRISFKLLHGESASVDFVGSNKWYSGLPNILQLYELKNIWNADETGLFFKQLPRKSLVFNGKKAKGTYFSSKPMQLNFEKYFAILFHF